MNKNPFIKFKNGKIVSVEHVKTADFNENRAYTKKRSAGQKVSPFYLLTLLMVNAGIWAGALIYLNTAKPKYRPLAQRNIPGMTQEHSQDRQYAACTPVPVRVAHSTM